jgi:hypothetical protein
MMPHSHSKHGCGCLPPPPMRCCRKEAKELLVQEAKAAGDPANNPVVGGVAGVGRLPVLGNEAIIGGGCCVQLSVEYMPATVSLQDQVCSVAVEVQDSEGTLLAWKKQFKEGYHVKECIITTYPGAKLAVIVNNAIARVRWCEVFSC